MGITLDQARESNSRIPKTLPQNLVAVFLGGTSGIGEYTLLEFARFTNTLNPTVYFIGRSQTAADRILQQCQTFNPTGKFTFIRSDTSLLKNVDDVCRKIAGEVAYINLLFLTQGTLLSGVDTSESLHLPAALLYYARTRFTLNLLPLLTKATRLKRVVNIAIGTKEGPITSSDYQRRGMKLMKTRGHAASLITMTTQSLQEKFPDVSFVHVFPGWVRGGVARDNKGVGWAVVKYFIQPVLGPLFMVGDEECGVRNLFIATSGIFAAEKEGGADGVALADGINVATGVDGKSGSGVYSVDYDCTEGAGVQGILEKLRSENEHKKLWEHTEEEFKRITGTVSVSLP